MNFLGHLFFSNHEPELMYPNLFGDFVKGSDLSKYVPRVQKGIILHRKIDNYIDRHPAVLELAHHLYPELPKITGIAIDLFFDHLLAKNWMNFNTIQLQTFIHNFNQINEDKSLFPNEHFWKVMRKMKEGKWLQHTETMYGLKQSCYGVSKMISFNNILSSAPDVFLKNQKQIEESFYIFMKDAISYFDDFHNH